MEPGHAGGTIHGRNFSSPTRMPGSVSLVVRTLVSLNGSPDAVVPTAPLREYFRSFDIDLSFDLGPPLSEDPTDSTDSIRSFLAGHAPPFGQGGSGVLVVADIGFLGSLVNGMLLDAERRGACAVFTQATGFAFGSADSRFEIYAHEIGHLVNLTHEDADAEFTTTMDTWDERSEVDDRAKVWTEAIALGPVQFANRLRGFFGDGARRPLGLPMSQTCCDKLVGSPASNLEPWRSPFVGGDVQDSSDGPLRCEIEVHGQSLTVGQPLDFTVTLSLLPEASPQVIPAVLERTSGELVIQLQRPDGQLRILHPRQLSCTAARRRLRPRQKIRRHDSIISDCSDLVFPIPGRYRVRALVPKTESHSAWVAIDVKPASGALAEPAMLEFLRRGMPGGADAHWRQLDGVIADTALAPETRADFSSRAAGRGRRAFDPLRQFRAVASPAVAQQDALRRIAYLRRNSTDAASLHQAIDHAQRLFAAADAEHPTLDYLAHLRRRMLLTQKGRAMR